jgi:hypothetical protein
MTANHWISGTVLAQCLGFAVARKDPVNDAECFYPEIRS